jgi:uncharacterized protein YkwD
VALPLTSTNSTSFGQGRSRTAGRRRQLLSRVGVCAALLTAAVLPVTMVGAGAQSTPNRPADEAQFVTLINDLRSSQGLQPLAVHPDLERVARAWTLKMKSAGTISHNPNLKNEVTADWRKLGENVGVGSNVDILHKAFVNSPSHYRNLVDPAFDQIAVTIEYDSNTNELYVTEQFMDTDDRTTSTSSATPKPTAATAPNELALAKPKVTKSTKKRVVRKPAPTTVKK